MTHSEPLHWSALKEHFIAAPVGYSVQPQLSIPGAVRGGCGDIFRNSTVVVPRDLNNMLKKKEKKSVKKSIHVTISCLICAPAKLPGPGIRWRVTWNQGSHEMFLNLKWETERHMFKIDFLKGHLTRFQLCFDAVLVICIQSYCIYSFMSVRLDVLARSLLERRFLISMGPTQLNEGQINKLN